ncbi:MAG: protein kinase [Pseudomonadota bacterium]
MPFKETLYCPECYRSYESGHGYCPDHGAHLVRLPEEASLVGTIIAARYRVDEELGGGGVGVTYRASHAVIDRPIAIKVFRRFMAVDPAMVHRFDAEADAALQLKGRHTVQVYDSGRTEDGRLFLARELVEGPTLADLIAAHRRLTPVRALRAALGVARALEYAHARGVLHRGLSPSNIFLVETGGEEIARVADFGQAGILTGADGISMGPEGMALRPLGYLAPEQAVGASCDVPADLYALGAVLFEALTGRPPFEADTPVELLLAHPQAPIPSFAERAPDADLPAQIETLVRKLLAKQPKQRPASAAVLAAELEVLLKDPAVARSAPAMGALPTDQTMGGASAPTPAVGGASAPTPAVGGASTPRRVGPEGPPTVEPEPGGLVAHPTLPPPPEAQHGLTDPVGSAAVLLPRKSKLPWILGVVVVLVLAVVGLFASGVISQKVEEPAGESEAVEAAAGPSEPAEPATELAGTLDVPATPELIVDPRDVAPADIRPEEITAEDIQPDEVAPAPEDTRPEIAPAAIPDIQSEAIPDRIPDCQSDIVPDIVPDAQPEVKDSVEDERPPREEKKPPREEKKPPIEEKKPPVEEKKTPEEEKKPPEEEKKPDPVIAKPAGMGDSDFALAKEQVSWGRKNMKKQLWEMAILNFQQAQRMGLTDSAIGRYIKECRNHMVIVADALERAHAALLASQWDEAIRQFQRARDHGEKNTTTFRLIEQAKESKAQEEADRDK